MIVKWKWWCSWVLLSAVVFATCVTCTWLLVCHLLDMLGLDNASGNSSLREEGREENVENLKMVGNVKCWRDYEYEYGNRGRQGKLGQMREGHFLNFDLLEFDNIKFYWMRQCFHHLLFLLHRWIGFDHLYEFIKVFIDYPFTKLSCTGKIKYITF